MLSHKDCQSSCRTADFLNSCEYNQNGYMSYEGSRTKQRDLMTTDENVLTGAETTDEAGTALLDYTLFGC